MSDVTPESTSRMPLIDSLRVLHDVRTDEVVVTTMGTAREWMAIGSHELDFVYVPSSMGQATTLGLGIALAQPSRKVIVCNGDGSMLMNLGSLVTITAQAPPNFTLLLFDNGVYEVTGAQPTAGSAAIRNGNGSIEFPDIARACGFRSIFEFDDLNAWQAGIRQVIDARGPTFAHLAITPISQAGGPRSPSPAAERARRFAAALQNTHKSEP